MTEPLPALYLGHGAPPLLDDPLWMAAARRLVGASCRGPRPILIVSAHWQTAPMAHRRHDDRPARLRLLRLPAALLRPPVPGAGCAGAGRVGQGADARQRARPRPPDPRPGPRRVGAAHGDVPGRRHPRPPDVDAGPGPRAPVRGRPPAGAAARRGRAGRRLRVHDPRPAVHRRVLGRPAGRARRGRVEFDRVGGGGPRARRRRHAVRVPREGARACRTRTRRSSTSRRCSSPSAPPRSRTTRRRPPSTATSSACRSARSRRA